MNPKPVSERNWFLGFHKVTLYDRTASPWPVAYLVRYHILHTRWGRIMLHHILISDPSDCPHDHPWNFVSIMLKGAYTEHRFVEKFPRYKFDWLDKHNGRWHTKTYYESFCVLRRPASTAHRLELPEGKTCWTLVITSNKKRAWGFWSIGRWIPWKKFVGSPHKCD